MKIISRLENVNIRYSVTILNLYNFPHTFFSHFYSNVTIERISKNNQLKIKLQNSTTSDLLPETTLKVNDSSKLLTRNRLYSYIHIIKSQIIVKPIYFSYRLESNIIILKLNENNNITKFKNVAIDLISSFEKL